MCDASTSVCKTVSRTYFYPTIDYRSHPAFACLDVPARDDDTYIEDLVDRIDVALGTLHSAVFADDRLVDDAFNEGPRKEIEMLRGYLRSQSFPDRVRQLIERSLDDVAVELSVEARLLNARNKTRGRELKQSKAATVCQSLRRDGCYICHVDEWVLRRLRSLTGDHQRRLREKAKVNPAGRVVENFSRYSDVGVLLNRYFSSTGILSGLSEFMGANTNFVGLALEYSHDKQTWWRSCYAELGMPDSSTAYMHYDHGCKYPKAILALSDVTDDNGPTGYVKGSHRNERSNFIHFMIKSIDLRFYDTYKNETGDSYYRRRFKELQHRREFMLMPRVLQSCSHFGEDIQDDSVLSVELLRREVRLTSDIGNCVVFDGDYGIHRGAMVRQGERFALQIIFAVDPPLSVSYAISQRARYLAKKFLRARV